MPKVDPRTRDYVSCVSDNLFARGFVNGPTWSGRRAVLSFQTPFFSEWVGGFDLVWDQAVGWSCRGVQAGRSPNHPDQWTCDSAPDRPVTAVLPVPVFACPAAIGRWMHRLVMGDLDIPTSSDLWADPEAD